MQRIDENSKSVRFTKEVDTKLIALAGKLGRTKREIFVQMLDYFYRSKKDPSDLHDELLKKELSRGINRILSFIQKQELDLLSPIFRMSDEITNLIKLEATLSRKVLENQNKLGVIAMEHKKSLLEQKTILEQFEKDLSNKQQLKLEFRKILEYYISNREALGWSVIPQKKEELIQKVKLALDQL